MTRHNRPQLPSGKLPGHLLAALLADLPTQAPDLLLGPAFGEDAAVIDFSSSSDRLLVAKSDPITFATDEIGYYAVNICVNDLAVTGATPRFYLPTLLLPAGATTEERVTHLFRQIGEACADLGIVVAGGHTEITHAVNQPVVAGTLLGDAPRDGFISSGSARPGDVILMAGVAPVEGTSIIAREKRDALLQGGWSAQDLDIAASFLYDPGISVLEPARAAAAGGRVTAMHDPTEGGIATGLAEMALAAHVGMEVDLDAIVIPDLSRRLCAHFGLDPLGVIASGALLAASAPEHAEEILAGWRDLGWPAAIIGRLTEGSDLVATSRGRRQELPRFQTDEITRLWA